MPKKRRKTSSKSGKKIRHSRQREKFIFRQADKLLSEQKRKLDNIRANDYYKTTTQKKEIRQDLRHLTKNPYLRKRVLRYGPKDKVARLYLQSRTKDGKPYKATPRLGFRDAKRVEVCQRRAKRREQLFKMRKAGKGRRIRTKKTRNEYSHLRC